LGGTQDAFVAKLTAEGTAVVYATYLGGSASETGAGIAVDGEGQAYVTGSTDSADFPTQNALQPTFGGVQDAFVTKLSADGTALVYSTYGGGSGADTGAAIAVDGEGQAYVTGVTASADLPILNALDPTLGGTQDAFVAKLTAAGTAVVYATYLGGSASEAGAGIAVDGAGQVYVTGSTTSTDFPTLEALDTTLGGTGDAFVTQLNAEGTGLIYSTYLGGSGSEAGAGIAVADEVLTRKNGALGIGDDDTPVSLLVRCQGVARIGAPALTFDLKGESGHDLAVSLPPMQNGVPG
jgi:hypothetical protein